MSEVKVSIIVPVYNVENYLTTCLDSLINQTLKDIEIICINDGSSDSSLSILQDYAKYDSRISIINKQNEGQAVARNLGIQKATGEYLGFVDSDDWIDLDYFEKMYNAAMENDCDIACAGFKRCRKRRKSIKKSYNAKIIITTVNDKVKMDNIPQDNYIWNKIYRKTSWEKAGIEFKGGRYFEDIELVIKILYYLGKMITVPNTYYFYRDNPNSTVKQKSLKLKKDYVWAFKEFYRFVEDKNIFIRTDNILQKKEKIKIFNFTFIKIYYYEYLVRYYLFGFIPLFKREIVI